MSEKAVEVGMGKIFNAAILALQRQDEDSKVWEPKWEQRDTGRRCWEGRADLTRQGCPASRAGPVLARPAVHSPSLGRPGSC